MFTTKTKTTKFATMVAGGAMVAAMAGASVAPAAQAGPQDVTTQCETITKQHGVAAPECGGPTWPVIPTSIPVKTQPGWLTNAPMGYPLARYAHQEFDLQPWTRYAVVRDARIVSSKLPGCVGANFAGLKTGGGLLTCWDPTTNILVNRHIAPTGKMTMLTKGPASVAPDGEGFAILANGGEYARVYNQYGTLRRVIDVPRSTDIAWRFDLIQTMRSSSGDLQSFYFNPATGARTSLRYTQMIGGQVWDQNVTSYGTCVTNFGQKVVCDRDAGGYPFTLVPNRTQTRIAVVRGEMVVAVIDPVAYTVYVLPQPAIFYGWETNLRMIMATNESYEEDVYRVNVDARTVHEVPMDGHVLYGGPL